MARMIPRNSDPLPVLLPLADAELTAAIHALNVEIGLAPRAPRRHVDLHRARRIDRSKMVMAKYGLIRLHREEMGWTP